MAIDQDKPVVIIKEWQENIAQLILFAVESNFNLRGIVCDDAGRIFELLSEHNVVGMVASSSPQTIEDTVEIYNVISHQEKEVLFVSLEEGIEIDWKKYSLEKPDAVFKRRKCINELVKVFKENFSHDEDGPVDKFTRISMSPLAHFKNIDEDVYIMMRSGRYLKLFSEGDNVTTDDINKYQNKGLQDLHIHRNAYKWILSKIAPRMGQLVDNPEMMIDMAEIKSEPINGIDVIPIEGPVVLEDEFLEFLHTKAEQLVKGMMKSKSLTKYFKNLNINREESEYLNTRISIVSNIACGILQKLEWSQTATYEKILYAIHTHDIALLAHPKLMRFQTLEELDADSSVTPEEKRIYLDHCDMSILAVDDDPFSPPDVETIIMQHHELPSGEGFPNALSSSKIQPMATILIVALDFAERLIRDSETPPLIMFRKIKEDYKSASFVKVIQTLEEVLDPSKAKSGKVF